jgi:hypothetical protein
MKAEPNTQSHHCLMVSRRPIGSPIGGNHRVGIPPAVNALKATGAPINPTGKGLTELRDAQQLQGDVTTIEARLCLDVDSDFRQMRRNTPFNCEGRPERDVSFSATARDSDRALVALSHFLPLLFLPI